MQMWLLLLALISTACCFQVPPEWSDVIRSICLEAENGIYPHPSTDAQRLYGRSSMPVQVCHLVYQALKRE